MLVVSIKFLNLYKFFKLDIGKNQGRIPSDANEIKEAYATGSPKIIIHK